jgi:hypothetical protein
VEKGGRSAIATLARQFGGEKSRFVGRSSQPSLRGEMPRRRVSTISVA